MDRKFIGMFSLMVLAGLGIMGILFAEESPWQLVSASNAYVERYFPQDRVIDIYVTIDPDDFADMLANPLAEEYKVASVVVDGQKVDYVGIRTKGNSSLRSVASSSSQRYSFKIDFNQYIKVQNLDGLTKLNLNNSYSDPSFMREYLSYKILREMGIPTPAVTYANLYINDQLWGLYLAVEGIEEPFLQRYFGRDWGTLYKGEGGQGSDLVYIDDQIESYSGIRRMTTLKPGADEKLLQMIKALNQGEQLEQYLNIDQILRYFAVNTVLVNLDSYVGQFKHNYYLYEENGIFTILPWDYNMSFGGFGMGGAQSSVSLPIDNPVSGTTLASRPLLGKLLEVPQYKELYHQYIQEVIEGPFSLEELSQEIQRIGTMIRPYLANDPTKFYTMEQFEAAISSNPVSQQSTFNNQGFAGRGGIPMMGGNAVNLITFIKDRIENLTKQLTGELSTTGTSYQMNQRIMGGGGRFIPEGGGFDGEFPPVFPDRAEGAAFGRRMPEQNREIYPVEQQSVSLNELYILGFSVLLLVIVTVLLHFKKTKHSIR
ncbi:MAG: hypothetical protein GX208_05240 [Firmicutes bacterium]|nr:hypothetical protein [Bacillota bacterium]